MTPHEATKLVAVLKGAFPDQTVEVSTVKIYQRMLRDLPAREANEVVMELIATMRFLPRISEIRNRVFERRLGIPTAEDALELVTARYCRGQEPQGPRLPMFVAAVLASCGGPFGLRAARDPTRWREQFVRQYRESRNRAIEAESVKMLRALSPGDEETKLIA